ncbi:MAG: hypothetical protein JXB23_13305 [Candidatus Aminicenantes bacterium]|nr:hypothetical protein [Candidatus Aminicenantes bacterium]
MNRKIISLVSLVLFCHFLTSCATIDTTRRESSDDTIFQAVIDAREFQEINIRGTNGNTYRAKIIRLEGANVAYLPFPYWDVELLKIHIDEIRSIEKLKKSGNPGKALAYGFAIGFSIIGLISAASSKYNEDYQMGLLASGISGGAVGLCSFVISGLAYIGIKSKYEFSGMSDREKVKTIREIMGR